MEVSPSSPVEGNSKSPDDDVLQILEDLETFAEDMKDDFLGDGVGRVKVSRRKRNRGGRKQKCTKCNFPQRYLCPCPRGPKIPVPPEVMPVVQPVYHSPPEVVPIEPPIYQPPPEIIPIFLPFLSLFKSMGAMPMVSLRPQEVQILNCKPKKPRMRARGGRRRKKKKDYQVVEVESVGAVESAASEIVQS